MSEVLYSYIKGKGWVAETQTSLGDILIWKTADGRRLKLTEMGDSHIINTRNMLQRRLNERINSFCCGFLGCDRCTPGALDVLREQIRAFEAEFFRRRIQAVPPIIITNNI